MKNSFKFFTERTYKLLFILGGILLLTNCSYHYELPHKSHHCNDQNALTIDSAGTVPIFHGMASSSVIYVHNNSNTVISNIKYSATDSNNESNQTISPQSMGLCASIQPGQSCPLAFTTASPNSDDFRGSISVTAKYTINSKSQEFSQLINYAQITDKSRNGVLATSGVNIIGIPNQPSYGVLYLYGGGENQIYNVESLSIDKKSFKITQGDISGKQLASNAIQAVEIQAPANNCKNGVTFALTIKSNNNSGTYNVIYQNSFKVAPISNGAIVLAGNGPVINLAVTRNGTVQFYNAGNAPATSATTTAGSGLTITSNTCTGTIPAYASCTVSFSVSESSSLSSGNANITVNYSGGSMTSATSLVSWYTYGGVLLGMSANPSPIVFNATQSQNAVVTITNLGRVTVSNMTIPAPTVYSGTGTIAISSTGNTCTGASLAPSESCSYTVTANAESATSGLFNLNISGSYLDATKATKTYTRILGVGYTANDLAAQLSITAIPTFSIIGDGVNTQTQTITITNIGSAPATLSADTLTNTTGYTTALSGTSCTSPLAAGASCTTRSITFGPAVNTTESIISIAGQSSTFAYNISYSGGSQGTTTASAILNANILTNVSIAISAFNATNSTSGTGASGSSYVFPGSNPTGQAVTVTYKNNGSMPIKITGVNNTNSAFLWAINTSASTCYASGIPNKPLAANESCTVVFNNVISQNFMSLGNIGATYAMDLTLPQITYSSNSSSSQYQQTPTTPAGATKIFVNSTQATLTNSASISNGVVTVTNTIANMTGYTSIGVTSTMEDYFTGTPTMTNCTQDTATPGVRTQVCTLTAASSGSGVYTVAPNIPAGTILSINFALSSISPTGAFVSFSPTSTALTLNLTSDKYAYISGVSSTAVIKCTISNTTGNLSECTNAGVSVSATYRQLAFNNNYAYVPSGSTILKCNVNNTTGLLSGCINSGGSGVGTPYGITVNNGYVYIANTNGGASGITKCTISNTTGDLSSCSLTGSNFQDPWTIVFNNGYAYVINYNKAETICAVNSVTGALSSCVDTTATTSKQYGAKIYNNFFYALPDKCDINSVTGELSNCVNAGAGSVSNLDISFNNGYAYVIDSSRSTILKCNVNNTTGLLSGCISSGATGITSLARIDIN